MTKSRLDQLCAIYRKLISDAGIKPQVVDVTKSLSREEMLGHCLWVLDEKVEAILHRVGGFQEAVRLLGCIQGTAMACGLCTIAETRAHAARAGMPTWEKILD